MVGSPMGNYWVDDGKLTLNPPARLLDEGGQWIPSTMGPVANTIEFLRPACEADRDNRCDGSDSNDRGKTRGAKRKRQEVAGTISLEIVTPALSARHLAPVAEFENTRQRGMFRPRKLHPPFPRFRRVVNVTATRHDVLSSPRYHRPPPTGSQLPLPKPLNTSTQRGNTVGLRHPVIFAPLYGIGDRPAPRFRHMTTVHRTFPIRRTGPIVGSTTAARQPTPTVAPLAASGGDHLAQVHNRIAASEYPSSAAPVTVSDHGTFTLVDVTTRVSEYPSPPRQSSYFRAGDELTYQPNGQVRTFPGPYFLSREQAYNIGRWQFYPALVSPLATAAIDQSQEYNHNNRWGVSYIDPATGSHDDEGLVLTAEPNHAHASFHISCEHCGSQGHITNECSLPT